jgi:hypothetical protein
VNGGVVNGRDRGVIAAIAFAITSIAVRLVQLSWLHPLNMDEREFYRAARWISEGRLPFRDFWEHHTPLTWFLFAPFTRFTNSPGADAVLMMRWAQIPIWIATFWLANVWMRRAGIGAFARWSAMALALSSSLFMLPAIEYRVDTLACLLVIAALVMVQRGSVRGAFACGALLCLACFTNIRLGVVVIVTALLLRVVDTRERAWRGTARANWVFVGAIAAGLLALSYFVATDSLQAFIRQAFYENSIGAKYAAPNPGAFLHRLLVPFGIRLQQSDQLFSLAAFDFGGVVLLVGGFIGMARSLGRWKKPDDFFVLAVVQLANLLSVAAMVFIYNYHFELVVILMLPLLAMTIDAVPRRSAVLAVLVLAWGVGGFAAIFRGKELDLAYQDLVMREADARTRPDEIVWSGMIWALRRNPGYRFWFLPDMAHHLVNRGVVAPYRLADVLRDPPGAIVVDQFAIGWLVGVQRELGMYFTHHYVPLWRNLWIPGLSGRLLPGQRTAWIAPRDGVYHVYVSARLATHPWFDKPLFIAYYKSEGVPPLELPPPANDARLRWWIDRQPVDIGSAIALRKGQTIVVASTAAEPLGIILLPADDKVLVRQPPPGVTLEGVSTRVTHVPDFHAHIE